VVVEEIKADGSGSKSSEGIALLEEDDGYIIEENSPASSILYRMMDKHCNGAMQMSDEE
jgi:hypothetical protein